MIRIKPLIFLALLIAFAAAFGEPPTDLIKNIELTVGVGPSWIHSNDGSLLVTADTFFSIPDTTHVSTTSSSALEKIGVGYHLWFNQFSQRKYFNDLLLELNLYHVNATVKGEDWVGGDSSLNNYTFQAPLSSTRLMVDIKPSLFTFNNISPYPIVGMGIAWNTLSYRDQSNLSTTEQSYLLNLNSGLNRRIAYDLGLGASYTVSKHMRASLEYLYNRLGNLSTSTLSTMTIQPVTSASIQAVQSQNLLFNFSWQF